MKKRRVRLFLLGSLVSMALPLAAAQVVAADRPVPVRVFVPNMLEGAITELAPLLRARSGAPLEIEFVQMTKLVERLNSGETVDVAILTKPNIVPLAAKGLIRSQVDVVQSELGIAVADGVPLPAMKTTDDLIAFIKSTPSIALFGTGVSGVVFIQFAEKNGLGDVLKRKATIVSDGYAATLLRDGKVASAVQQVGELKFGGANNIVPLPDALQTRPVSAVVVFAHSSQPDAAARVAQLLASPEAAAAYRRGGLITLIR